MHHESAAIALACGAQGAQQRLEPRHQGFVRPDELQRQRICLKDRLSRSWTTALGPPTAQAALVLERLIVMIDCAPPWRTRVDPHIWIGMIGKSASLWLNDAYLPGSLARINAALRQGAREAARLQKQGVKCTLEGSDQRVRMAMINRSSSPRFDEGVAQSLSDKQAMREFHATQTEQEDW